MSKDHALRARLHSGSRSIGTLNFKVQEAPQSKHLEPELKKAPVIIGWYCRECSALHAATQYCPVTHRIIART